MIRKTNSAYKEYFEEILEIEGEEKGRNKEGNPLFVGIVVKCEHPPQRRTNSNIKTAPWDEVGDPIKVSTEWLEVTPPQGKAR